MDGVNFNVSQFIAEVRSRPLLYDSTSELYMDREAKAQAWDEILAVFCPDHESKEEDERSELVIQLQKKWKNIRDTFVRELRRAEGKGGKKRRYRHYKELLFLSGMMKPKNPLLRPTTQPEEQEDKRKVRDTTQPTPSSTSRKTVFHSTDKKRRREAEHSRASKHPSPPRAASPSPAPPPPVPLPSPADDESDRLFLLSLLADMKRVPDQFKLEVKCELMNVLKKFSSFSNPQDALQNCVFTTEEAPIFVFKNSPHHSSDESDM